MEESEIASSPLSHLPSNASELFARLLEEMPSISLGRNDPCPCNSGKKYKKCCLNKDRSSFPSEILSESFTITTDALTSKESKENYPPFSEEDEELLYELHCDLNEYPECIDSEDCDYFQKLAMLRLKYPDHPRILNYLANGYQCLGLEDKMREIVKETYERFPDYLFAQTALAHAYLQDGLPEKAIEILKRAYTLKQLYPQREVFHISEVKVFNIFMINYFCAIQNFKQAEFYLQMLEEVLESDDVLLQNVRKRFKMERGLYYFGAHMKRLLQSD